MALVFEKSLDDIRVFLNNNIATYVTAVNGDVTDGLNIANPKDIKTDVFDIYDSDRYPRYNLTNDDANIEIEALGYDEFVELIHILIGCKAGRDDQSMLKVKRHADAIRRAFLADNTAGGAVEFITVTRFKPYPANANGVAIGELTCGIKRQVAR